jgi:hypothetical protein
MERLEKMQLYILTFFDENGRHIKIMLLIILKAANLMSRSHNGGFFVSNPHMSAKDTKLSRILLLSQWRLPQPPFGY